MGAWETTRARIDALDDDRADALLGLVIALAAAIPVLLYAAPRQLPAALAIIAMQGVGLAYRRRRPVLGWCLAFTPSVLVDFIAPSVEDVMVATFVGTIFASYSLGANLADRRAWPFVFAFGAVAVVVQALVDTSSDTVVSDIAWGALGMLAVPILVGRFVRRRGGLNRTLRERAAAAELERGRVTAEAVAAERERIAADLHDVVAHALSAMVVQAAVARRDARTEPDRARAAFGAVEGTGREALTEIRRMLGVLRRDDEEIALAPQPSLEHLRSLVARARRAGLAVELTVDGTRRVVPAGIDLTGYRVVQAALEGARRDGRAGAATVAVRYEADAIALEVRDDGSAAERDLAGVRERVSLYGGELRAAGRRDGGHAVLARFPIGAPA